MQKSLHWCVKVASPVFRLLASVEGTTVKYPCNPPRPKRGDGHWATPPPLRGRPWRTMGGDFKGREGRFIVLRGVRAGHLLGAFCNPGDISVFQRGTIGNHILPCLILQLYTVLQVVYLISERSCCHRSRLCSTCAPLVVLL